MSRRRKGLTHEQLLEERRKDKRRRILLERGLPSKMTMEETEKVIAHIKDLYYTHHMSTYLIAEASGTHPTTIQTLMRGYRSRSQPTGREPLKGMWRSVGIKILAVQPALVTAEDPTWAKTPPHGTQRRLQALVADGFSYTFISQELGVKGNDHVWKTTNNKGAAFVKSNFAISVKAVYAKLAGTRPEDYGLSSLSIARTLTAARKHNWAPSGCWDWDTIDDPDAFPEWTGKCGTARGYRIHLREKIRSCRPCLDAYREQENRR